MHYTILASLGLAALAAAHDLFSALKAQPDLSTLLSAIQDAPGVAKALARASNITILAPTNDAFASIPPRSPLGTAIAAKKKDAIAALLAYHVIRGRYLSTDFKEAPQYVPTLLEGREVDGVPAANVTGGQNVGLQLKGSDATVLSGEMMSSVDIRVGHVIIHKIDHVLSLPVKVSAQATEAGLTGIVDALTTADLVEKVDNTPDLTVFVPSNKAFKALGAGHQKLSTKALTKILTYHVIAGKVLFSTELSSMTAPSLQGTNLTVTVLGDAVFINKAKVIMPNIITANGVVHVIDQVLKPGDTKVDVDSLPSVSAMNHNTTGPGGNAVTGNPSAGKATPTATNATGTRAGPGSNATATATTPATFTGAAALASSGGPWVQGGVTLIAVLMFAM